MYISQTNTHITKYKYYNQEEVLNWYAVKLGLLGRRISINI